MLYLSRTPSFISTQIFVVNLDGWLGVISIKCISFWYSIITLSYYYINQSLSMIHCLLSMEIFLSFGIFLSNPIFSVSRSTFSQLFCGEIRKTFSISSSILLSIISPTVPAVFSIFNFEVVLNASATDFSTWSRSFWLNLPLMFYWYFHQYF